ncbi:ABC transporter permease [Parasphaerochaeta coccoides]|uniref:Transport system permease protein n=1 Tax=Parasphaerochaeta coccoides (strain ATCC BAA-1237 / DSM 17374 / SPN1) TaxID=760011 RepID=F4GL02_PARC1|nr:iron chelate uptake ABC transporter family permease subunit [Parasphaerochaeta coccoides]AEC02342.1 transport system permease protein [Parasphaerochaeta coccoides DSM 17374]
MSRRFPRSLLVALTLLLCGISLIIGAHEFSISGLFTGTDSSLFLLAVSRFPRTASVFVSGVSLAVAGALMQIVASNKFIGPGTASTSQWAQLGLLAALLSMPDADPMVKMVIAFIFSFFGTMIFLKFIARLAPKDPVMVPLIGIMLGNVVGAVTMFIAYRADIVQNLTSWMQGDFSMVIRGRYELLYISLPFLILATVKANDLTIASMGKDMATNLGVSYAATVGIGLLILSVSVASVIVTVGSIPFIGIIVPNLVRIGKGDDLKRSLPDICMVGGTFLLVCDIIGRLVIYPFEIPVGVTASIAGAVLFLAMLIRERKHGKA